MRYLLDVSSMRLVAGAVEVASARGHFRYGVLAEASVEQLRATD